MAHGNIIQSSHRFHEPCSACRDGDTAMEYHKHNQQLRSYTVGQIKDYAGQFVRLNPVRNDLTPELYLSTFLAWLARREQRKES